MFLNSVRKNNVEAQVEFSLKVTERARNGQAHLSDVTVIRDTLLVYVLTFFGILAGRESRIHFKSDLFAAVAEVDAKTPLQARSIQQYSAP